MRAFFLFLCILVVSGMHTSRIAVHPSLTLAQISCPELVENNIKWASTSVSDAEVEVVGTCVPGYQASEGATFKRICQASGSWAPYDSQEGSCEVLRCPAETAFNYQWPATLAGRSATVSCPNDGDTGSVQRTCLLQANPTKAVWDSYILDTCNYSPIVNVEYPSSTLVLEQMQAFPSYFKPVVVDGFYNRITISPALPQSVKLDAQTGQFTGRFIDPLEQTTYTLTFSNKRYSYDVELTFTATAVYCQPTTKFGVNWPTTQAGAKYSYDCTEPGQTGVKSLYCLRGFPPRWSDYLASDCMSSAPRNVIYPSFHMKLKTNVLVAEFVPMYQGVVSRVYALDALPNGVTLDSTTGAIGGRPTRVTPDAVYRIRFEGTSPELYADVSLNIEVLELTCPFVAEQGYIFPESTVNTMASGKCPLGFSGTVTRECLASGEWAAADTIVANCERNYCPETAFVGDNGSSYVLPKTIGYSDVTSPCTYGSVQYHCRPDGTWELKEDTCKRCPAGEYLASFDFGVACVTCPKGLECPVGSSYRAPNTCTGVFYNDKEGSTQCKQCDLDTSYLVSNGYGNVECVQCEAGTYPHNGACVPNVYCPTEDGFDEVRAGLVQTRDCPEVSLKGYATRTCVSDGKSASWGPIDEITNCRTSFPPLSIPSSLRPPARHLVLRAHLRDPEPPRLPLLR